MDYPLPELIGHPADLDAAPSPDAAPPDVMNALARVLVRELVRANRTGGPPTGLSSRHRPRSTAGLTPGRNHCAKETTIRR
ncbi:MAG: hypothetical protein AAFT19_06415 [Pseudomonadota bacterium]